MAEIQPPSFVDVDGQHSPAHVNRMFRSLISEGVVRIGDLLCSKGAGGTMNVSVAKGQCWITGDDNADEQGVYHMYNNGPRLVGLAVADGSNPRKDLIIAQVEDQDFAGDERTWRLDKITGAPGAVPLEPAVPNNTIVLALVDVPAAAADIVACTLTDRRSRAQVGGGDALSAGAGGWGAWG